MKRNMLDQCATTYFSPDIVNLQTSYRVTDLIAINRGVGATIRIESEGVVPFIGKDQFSQRHIILLTPTAMIFDTLSIAQIQDDGGCKNEIDKRIKDQRRAS